MEYRKKYESHIFRSSVSNSSFAGISVYLIRNKNPEKKANSIFQPDSLTVLILKSGRMQLQLENNVIPLNKGDFITISFNSFCKILSLENKIIIGAVSFTVSSLSELNIPQTYASFFVHTLAHGIPKLSLDQTDACLIFLIIKILFIRSKISRRTTFISIGIHLILHELTRIHRKYHSVAEFKYTSGNYQVFQFLLLLESNVTKEKKVKFYAEALFVTSDHLSKMVKSVTHKTAKYFIQQAILKRAKILLREDITVSEISYSLGFKSLDKFSRFFKSSTSVSPSTFRQQLNPEDL